MADVEQRLARRAQIADEMTTAIGRLGVLVREEKELATEIRRALGQAGISAQPFSTAPNVEEIINHELGRAGVEAWRVATPFGVRLTDLVDRQHRNVRELLATRVRASGPAAA
jgi:hypothetical protein